MLKEIDTDEIKLIYKGIKSSLSKNLLRENISETEFKSFKNNLVKLINETETASDNKQGEENRKNLFRDFLKQSFYDGKHFLNTMSYKGNNEADLVIHSENNQSSDVSVIFEVKTLKNKSEMISKKITENKSVEHLQKKCFWESVLYFFWEVVYKGNLELKNIVITNISEFYIFSASEFKRVFLNSSLKSDFEKWQKGSKIDSNTDTFYKLVENFINNNKKKFNRFRFTYFDIREIKDDEYFKYLYKIISPKFLLKQDSSNDSNTLDKDFYNELLHIIGLEEVDKEGKKLIQRKKSPDSGSLLENTISALKENDRKRYVSNLLSFGNNENEQYYNIALSLCIRWINRILFLKLLEGQLFNYHNGDKNYKFLEFSKIKTFKKLNRIFFSVLAKKSGDREEHIQKEFFRIPYLNSSLFENSKLEEEALAISFLEDDLKLDVYKNTVLKDGKKKLKGSLTTFEYLLSFLNSYDFGSEEKIDNKTVEENKKLINASVLGLIFEKINGYKDGSFYTPSFITTYMCRESIEKCVLQKFNDKYNWNCHNIEDLKDKIENKKEANELINTIKICDPAVGSGHFLVSALNEIISLKSELGVLFDTNGKRIRDYRIENNNDDLQIIDEDNDDYFSYKITSHTDYFPVERVINKSKNNLQKALFFEKKNIIENCLFGVDINNNSVMICGLRLWIELLKSSYYTEESNYTELETLPNIDINIKQGNSLISRYDMEENLSKVFNKKGFSVKQYRDKVRDYKQTNNKDSKKDILNYIDEIKSQFRTEFDQGFLNKIKSFEGELKQLESNMFGVDKETKKEISEKQKKLSEMIQKKDDIENSVIYKDALEWRFEFPEVLDEKGDFVGFDVVIGNPPYMRVQEINRTQPNEKLYYEGLNDKAEKRYINASASYDLANLFFELAIKISSKNCYNSFIFPHKFFNSSSTEIFRNYLSEGQYINKISHFGANMIFDDADTYTCITQFSNKKSNNFLFQRFPFKSDFQKLMIDDSLYSIIDYQMIDKASELYGSNQWILFDNPISFSLFEKIYTNSKTLKDCFDDIFQGLATSKDELYVVEKISETENTLNVSIPISNKIYEVEKTFFKPFLMGRDVHKYSNLKSNKYVFFPYELNKGEAKIIDLEKLKNDYPLTHKYVLDHEKEFRARESGRAGKMNNWIAYIYPKNLTKFEQIKLSSMEICTKNSNITLDRENFYHSTTVYSWVKKENISESYEYFLSIANSKLLWWFLKLTGDTLQGDARRLKTNYLNPFPVPQNVNNQSENEIKSMVLNILENKKNNIDTIDLEKQIDQMVYKLYGFTEDEIKIVEEIN